MDFKLFNAVLAMDSYNRGYNAGIDLRPRDEHGNLITDSQGEPIASDRSGTQIGVASISINSGDLTDSNGQRLDIPSDFYAVAYNIGGAGTIISYRGTDSALDAAFGYGVGAGTPDVDQGVLAFGFYQAVANGTDPRLAPISVTGHSLGGGLARFLGANDNYKAERKVA